MRILLLFDYCWSLTLITNQEMATPVKIDFNKGFPLVFKLIANLDYSQIYIR